MPIPKRSRRGVAGFPVRIVVGDAAHAGVAENFSCSGMFIQTDVALEIGDPVRLDVELPDHGLVTLQGSVARVLRRSLADALDSPMGIGVCFDDTQPANEPEHLLRLGQLLVDTRALAEVSEDLRGELAQVPLRSVLRFLEVVRRTGTLVLDQASTKQILFVRDGEVWAQSPAGIELHELLEWTSGSFQFVTTTVDPPGSAAVMAISDLLRTCSP